MAEEEDIDRLIRAGRLLHQTARAHGWPDDGGEGAQEYLLRRAYARGWDDARDESAGLLAGADL